MEVGFRDVVERAAAVGRDVQRADVHEIFRHGGPNPGANPSALAALRRRVDLPMSYAQFLTYCDGWVGLDGATDLFGIAELLDGPATEQAWVLVEAYDEGSGWQFGLARDRYLVIGAADSSLSVILLDLASAPCSGFRLRDDRSRGCGEVRPPAIGSVVGRLPVLSGPRHWKRRDGSYSTGSTEASSCHASAGNRTHTGRSSGEVADS
ncbi:SMI1/KNR4 family protein [Dactylosporangium sp. NPDC049742]|uniref:SMI1/KNR4 family protein n=1 Tax=Dactylosporangium sp. NPDC049742 TaxID=3154737 RepID=UPI0034333A19